MIKDSMTLADLTHIAADARNVYHILQKFYLPGQPRNENEVCGGGFSCGQELERKSFDLTKIILCQQWNLSAARVAIDFCFRDNPAAHR